jgi:hypothetical protein
MSCPELASMRLEASRIFREFNQRRRRAREQTAKFYGRHAGPLVRPSDFEGYLQRRLAKASASIESHIALHHCQE